MDKLQIENKNYKTTAHDHKRTKESIKQKCSSRTIVCYMQEQWIITFWLITTAYIDLLLSLNRLSNWINRTQYPE